MRPESPATLAAFVVGGILAPLAAFLVAAADLRPQCLDACAPGFDGTVRKVGLWTASMGAVLALVAAVLRAVKGRAGRGLLAASGVAFAVGAAVPLEALLALSVIDGYPWWGFLPALAGAVTAFALAGRGRAKAA